jgi:hypothetical protein
MIYVWCIQVAAENNCVLVNAHVFTTEIIPTHSSAGQRLNKYQNLHKICNNDLGLLFPNSN